MNDALELYGIASSDKFYRLAYFLSKAIQADLTRKTQHTQFHVKFNDPFDFYYAYDGDSEFFLIESKINGTPILKKNKNINYYLLVKTSFLSVKKNEMQSILSGIKIIMASFKIESVQDVETISQLFTVD